MWHDHRFHRQPGAPQRSAHDTAWRIMIALATNLTVAAWAGSAATALKFDSWFDFYQLIAGIIVLAIVTRSIWRDWVNHAPRWRISQTERKD